MRSGQQNKKEKKITEMVYSNLNEPNITHKYTLGAGAVLMND